MLERETDLILQLLTERSIGARESIALHQVQDSAIPKNIRRYLQCEVVRWLSADMRGTPAFSHIPTNTKTSRSVLGSLLQSLAQEYVFSREEFLVTLENAVHFLENYLCRPQWTLDHFVFENEEQVSAETLFAKLEYLIDYSYFRDLIERTVRRQEWNVIDRDAFRALVARFDDQIVKQHTARELAMLAKPIYDFLSLEESSMDQPIPLKPLLLFFDDKRMRILKEYIERVAEIRRRGELSLSELGEIVEKLHISGNTSMPLAVEQEAGAASSESPELPSSPASENVMQEESPTTSIEEKPPEQGAPLQAVEEANVSPLASQSADTSEDEHSPRLNNPGRANPMLSLTYAGLKETQEARPLPDLQTLIAGEQRGRFIKNVFKDDEPLYTGVLTALNEKLTWKEASVYLDEQYQISSLDPFDDDVIEFTDAIHRRYTAEAGGAE
jgi:hypothetical protein